MLTARWSWSTSATRRAANRPRRPVRAPSLLVVATLLLGLHAGAALGQDAKNHAQAMRDLRIAFLSSSASSMGFQPTKEYPRVFGVAMDWPVGEHTATIVTALDGSASLYTT